MKQKTENGTTIKLLNQFISCACCSSVGTCVDTKPIFPTLAYSKAYKVAHWHYTVVTSPWPPQQGRDVILDNPQHDQSPWSSLLRPSCTWIYLTSSYLTSPYLAIAQQLKWENVYWDIAKGHTARPSLVFPLKESFVGKWFQVQGSFATTMCRNASLLNKVCSVWKSSLISFLAIFKFEVISQLCKNVGKQISNVTINLQLFV